MAESSGFAVIRTGGKQYRVSPGQRIIVERLEGEVGSGVELTEVLMHGSEGTAPNVGTPLIKGAKVSAKIVAQDRSPKVMIFKKRRRKGYEKLQGHRQERTTLLIESISA
jgi:large subunit ribosomal protein L21